MRARPSHAPQRNLVRTTATGRLSSLLLDMSSDLLPELWNMIFLLFKAPHLLRSAALVCRLWHTRSWKALCSSGIRLSTRHLASALSSPSSHRIHPPDPASHSGDPARPRPPARSRLSRLLPFASILGDRQQVWSYYLGGLGRIAGLHRSPRAHPFSLSPELSPRFSPDLSHPD